VPDVLVRLRAAGVKAYIYSSGSRQAQRDLFAHTTAGDMRPYLCGFFDTQIGAKVGNTVCKSPALKLFCCLADRLS
jgi:methylthioribulose 1-phosphate dehydratase/enolase-phosphatase E1